MGSPHAALVPVEWLLLLQVLVLLAGTAVHELGHALAARAVGFEVAGVRVGPVLAHATPRGWRVRLVVEIAVGGELLSVPGEPDRLRARHAAMIAAGPAAHLLAALAVLAAAASTGALLLWITAATLGLSGLVNLVPGRPRLGGRWTDGQWLLVWLVRPERATQRVALGVLQRAAAAARPRDWDERWARLAASGPRQPADAAQVAGCLLAYAHALDRGETDRAAALLTRAFAARHLLPAGGQAALALQAAFFTARFRGNPTLAKRLLQTGLERPDRARALDVDRARAAVLLASGQPAEAAAAAERALAGLDAAWRPPAGLLTLDRELLEAMRERARSTSADHSGQILCSGGFVPIGQGGLPPSSMTAGPLPAPDEPEDVGAGAGRAG
jgi:membrane-associated protease RseP (regulator of RpoE activity)